MLDAAGAADTLPLEVDTLLLDGALLLDEDEEEALLEACFAYAANAARLLLLYELRHSAEIVTVKGIAQHFRLAQILQFTHALACEIRDIFETCCPPVKTQRATASATAAATLRFQRCCRFSLLRARKCCSLLSRYTIRYTQSILAIRTDPRTALEISLENAAADLGRVRQRKGGVTRPSSMTR